MVKKKYSDQSESSDSKLLYSCQNKKQHTEVNMKADLVPWSFSPVKFPPTQLDLVNTVGEAASLGAAGVVSWGDMNVTQSEVQ